MAVNAVKVHHTSDFSLQSRSKNIESHLLNTLVEIKYDF